MSLRKCQAIKNDRVEFEGLFHQFATDEDGDFFALIEKPDGIIFWWPHVIKFLEPQHPRVEVKLPLKEPRPGNFAGWFQSQDADWAGCVGLVEFDDGTNDSFAPEYIKFLKGGTNE